MKASTVSFIFFACIILKCVLGGNVTLPVNQVPLWDLCVNGGDIFSCSGHGMCSGPSGQCVCTGGYTGRDCSIPPGGQFPYGTPLAAVTQFCQLETGGCSPGMCVGGGEFDGTNLPNGVDGVAAVNPTLFGSRYAYTKSQGAGSPMTLNGMYSFVGQSCGTCWKLTRKSVSIVVTVVDRCAGYCRATAGNNQHCTASGLTAGKECGECIQANEPSVPQCSCLSPNSTNNHGWCDGNSGAHCDWCAANDHPHFDLDITAQMKICGEAGGDGFCFLDSFQMVACPSLKGPWPNGSPDGLVKAPISASSSSSSSGSNTPVKQGTVSGTCSVVNDQGVCSTLNSGDYMCNGCNLTMCSFGQIHNLGCPAGTSCFQGQCAFSSTCDPKVSLSAACAATAAPTTPSVVTPDPTSAPSTTKAPPTGATSRPTPTPTPAPTPAPTTTPAPTPANTPAPAATPSPQQNVHPCQARKRRTAQAEEAQAVVEQLQLEDELESSPVEALIEPEALTPYKSSASLLAVSSLTAIVAVVLYL